MEHARHVLRVVFLLILVVVGFTLFRSFVVPSSYGMYGPYRFDDVAEQRTKPVIHRGSASCKGCHPKQWTLREDGEMHMKVSCEVCHGPLTGHATGDKKDDKKLKDMPMDKTWVLCARCHRKLDGRPKDFPQVNLDDEKHTKGEKIEGQVCKKCHDPHSTLFEEEPAAEEGDAGEKKEDAKEEKKEDKKDEKKEGKK